MTTPMEFFKQAISNGLSPFCRGEFLETRDVAVGWLEIRLCSPQTCFAFAQSNIANINVYKIYTRKEIEKQVMHKSYVLHVHKYREKQVTHKK